LYFCGIGTIPSQIVFYTWDKKENTDRAPTILYPTKKTIEPYGGSVIMSGIDSYGMNIGSDINESSIYIIDDDP